MIKVKALLIMACLSAIISDLSAQQPKIEWVAIPGGSFLMGSLKSEKSRVSDETQHEVTLNGFRISKYEITVDQFRQFIDATGYVTDAENGTGPKEKGSAIWKGNEWHESRKATWRCGVDGKPRPLDEYNHPVIHVSWNDAKAFAKWMECDLPTEAEWEYAARAGTSTPFNTGKCLTLKTANYNGWVPYPGCQRENSSSNTMPVGSYQPNTWGICDMHGNVWEWCHDWYGLYNEGSQTDPKGPETGTHRSMRGGSWLDCARDCRCAYRSCCQEFGRYSYIGFRIVLRD